MPDLQATDRCDAGYEQLRHAVLHARAEAFPLGLGLLRRAGVTAWRRATHRLGPTPPTSSTEPGTPTPPAGAAGPAPALSQVPAGVSAQLIDVLATVALAGTTPRSSTRSPGAKPAPAVAPRSSALSPFPTPRSPRRSPNSAPGGCLRC